MSQYGISEFKRWDAEVVQAIPGILAADVRDELVAFDTGLGLTARVQYRGLLGAGPNQPLYQMTPEFIPGRAIVYHERKHNLDDLVGRRVGGQYEFGWIEDLFKIRGATLPANQQLAIEQAASMLPEAFIGEWGGYLHPMFGLDPVAVSDGIRAYFATPAAAAVRAFIRGFATWTPSPELVARMQPNITMPPIVVPPASAPPTPGIVDVRGVLPLQGNIFGTSLPKDSLTFHWNGPALDLSADPVDLLKADATFHIGKGWGGISYHKAIWVDGTLYLCRDMDAVLAACGDAIGNARSQHVQVMVGEGQTPTAAQWARMAELSALETTVHPHNFWSNTSCPGPEISDWIANKRWEDDMFTEADRAKLNRVYDHLEAYEPMTWISRLQEWLAKAFRSLPVLQNADLSGPDVKTGDPFK